MGVGGILVWHPSAASNTSSSPQPKSNFIKHPLQNTENDCHIQTYSGFLTALECTKFVFGRGFAPDPTGELTALPRPPSGFNGDPISKGAEDKEREGNGRIGRMEGKGTPPLTQIPGSALAAPPLYNTVLLDPPLQRLLYTTPFSDSSCVHSWLLQLHSLCQSHC